MNFLTNLEQQMDLYSMNRSDVARACGLSTSTVNSWWNRGYENVSMQTLIKLTKCFNCSLEELVNGVPNLYNLSELGISGVGLVYTKNEYSQDELKLIDLYANFLKSLRDKGVKE